MNKEAVVQGLGVVGVGFGVAALLAPDRLSAVYGLQSTPSQRLAARLFGSRNLALGVSAFLAQNDEDRDRVLALLIAIGGVDVLSALVGLRSGLSARAVAQLVATSGAVTAAAASARAAQ